MARPIPDLYTIPRAVRGYSLSILAQGLCNAGLTRLPVGHAEPAFIVTGLFGPKMSTNQLLRFLKKHDYNAMRLDADIHIGPHETAPPYGNAFARGVKELHMNTGKPVHLIGWSLGGLVAKLYAGRHPEHVASVHTLASPWMDAQKSSYLAYVQPLLSCIFNRGVLTPELNAELQQEIAVPHYSYVAEYDEIVDPALCGTQDAEHFPVGHLEIGFTPEVYAALLNNLSQNLSHSKQSHLRETLENRLDGSHSLQ